MNMDWRNRIELLLSMERFSYFYERHRNHLSSLDFAEALRAKVEAMLVEMAADADDQHLVRDAVDLLFECRRVLAWSYVWAFFQQDADQLTDFEVLQNDLETMTEQLSSMIEGEPGRPTTSWLWMALCPNDELDQLVASFENDADSQAELRHIQRRKLNDIITALRPVLAALKERGTNDSKEPTSEATAEFPGAAPKAVAKRRAKAKVKAKAKQRMRQNQ